MHVADARSIPLPKMQHQFQHTKKQLATVPPVHPPSEFPYSPLAPTWAGSHMLSFEKCNLTFEPFIYLVPCLPNSFLQRWERRREEARRRERERVTISRTMPPMTFFPTASQLMDTKIDLRGGHLTVKAVGGDKSQAGGMEWAHCP
jgi:hypothetical protein